MCPLKSGQPPWSLGTFGHCVSLARPGSLQQPHPVQLPAALKCSKGLPHPPQEPKAQQTERAQQACPA